MKRKISIALMLVLVLSMFSACKSNTVREEVEESEPELDDAIIDEILEKGYLTVGCSEENTALFEYDEKTEEYSGLEVNIAYKTAADIFGVTIDQAKDHGLVKFVPTTTEDRETGLTRGYYDVLLCNYTITEERKKTFAFSDSYYTDYLAVLVSDKSNIEDVASLVDLNVGVVRSSTSEEHLQKYFASLGSKVGVPFFFEYADLDSAVEALKSGIVSAVCCDENLIDEFVTKGYSLLDERVVGQHYGAAVKLENELLLDYVNDAIAVCIE